ncbi:MAG: hypothetical protein HKL90_15200 [Elusimicrobia bacterium]|nr:hypothetical protein [Elusimicrobiota bacterium]
MRRLAWAAAGLALAAALALRVGLVRARYFDTDELEHLHATLLVAHGNTPFRDFFEHHGPLFWAALAPVVSGFHGSYASAEAGRAAVSLAWLGILLLVLRRREGADALEGTAAAVLLAFFGAFAQKSLEIRPDVPAAFLLISAAWICASRRRDAGAWCGILLGLGAWLSPKIIFGAAGLLAAALWRRRASGAREFALQTCAAVAAVAALGLGWFAARGALRPLWDLYVVFNGRFHSGAAPWSATLRPSLISDPAAWLLGAAGLARWRRRPEEAGILVGALAGLFVSPSAYPQYLLFVAPALCVLAASALDGWVRAGRVPVRRAVLAGATVLLASAATAASALARIKEGNALQRERWACVDARVPPGAAVLDVWSGDSFARPHAAKIWFLPDDEQANLNLDWVVDGMIAGLRDPRTRGVIWCESCFARLPPRFSAEVRRHYVPSGCGRLWLRAPEKK